MSSKVYNLGEIEHIHNNQNLKLRTNVHISLSSSEMSLFSPHILDLEALISSGTWFVGGNRLHLHLHFSFDDIEVSDMTHGNMIEDIGLMLCRAKVPQSTLGPARMTYKTIDMVSTSL